MNNAIINKVDKAILSFLNALTEEWKNEYDIQMFYDILNGKRYEDGKLSFKLRIGSARRLDVVADKRISTKMLEKLPFMPYDEFKIQVTITSESFYMIFHLFHHATNNIEGFTYRVNSTEDSGIVDETWVLPGEDNIDTQTEIDGRKPELLLQEIKILNILNREIKIISELNPSEESYKIHKQFDELMEFASDEEIAWALANEFEREEKINVLQNLSTDRKLQIIQNLTNEKKCN